MKAVFASFSIGATAVRCSSQTEPCHSIHRDPLQSCRISVVIAIISSVSSRRILACSRFSPACPDARSTSCSAFTAQDKLLDNAISFDLIIQIGSFPYKFFRHSSDHISGSVKRFFLFLRHGQLRRHVGAPAVHGAGNRYGKPVFTICAFQPHRYGQDIPRVMDNGLYQPSGRSGYAVSRGTLL